MTVFNADLLPASAGKNLGSLSQPWNLYAESVFLNGNALAAQGTTYSVVTYSAAPTFATAGNNSIFKMTLTGNVVSSSLTGTVAGNLVTFIIVQDGTGGRAFAWPGTVLGGTLVGQDANAVTVQTFVFDGTNAYPIAPGSIYP